MPNISNHTSISEDAQGSLEEVEYWRQKYNSLENELNEINFRMGLMFQNIKQGYWYWNLKTDETYYSPEYFLILGYEVNEFRFGYRKWLSLIHPEDRPKIIEAQVKFLNNIIPEFDVEFRMLTKSGEYIWILNRAYQVSFNENGKCEKIVGMITDIDKHKKNQNIHYLNETRLNLALEVANQGIWDWDLSNDQYYHNQTYYHLLGYEPNEVALDFEFWQKSIHPEDKDAILELENQIIAGKIKEYSLEYRMMTKTGAYKWFLCTTKLLSSFDNGQAQRLMGVIMDINERKLSEQAIQQSEEKFKLLIEHNLAAICIYNNESFLYANPEFFSLFGYQEADLKALSPEDIIHPDLALVFDNETKTNTKKALNRYILKAIAKNGEEKWVDLNSTPITYQNERVNITTMYDISERVKSEKALKEAYEAIKTTEEELRQNAEEMMAINETLASTKAQLEKTLDHEKKTNQKIERKNLALYNQKKVLKETLRQLKQTQMQLVQAEKMASLGVLVAGIAHEMNNPVNYINSSAEGLKLNLEDVLDLITKYEEITPANVQSKLAEIENYKQQIEYKELASEVKQLIDNISEGAEQTAEIVRGLRTFSHLESDEKELVDVRHSIETALILLHNQYKHDIDIEKNLLQVPPVLGQQSKLNQVIINLLTNAIYAIKKKPKAEQGKIILKTYQISQLESKFVVIEIEDNGCGMTEDIQKRIFEPFFTTKEIGEGTGLGLSISLGIIQSFGGKIELSSVPQKGSKFTIFLPLHI